MRFLRRLDFHAFVMLALFLCLVVPLVAAADPLSDAFGAAGSGAAAGGLWPIFVQYVAPILATGLASLVAWSLKRQAERRKADDTASARDSLLYKAADVVSALEQRMRPEFAKATADGKLTPDEARQLAGAAVRNLFEVCAAEVATLRAGGYTRQQLELMGSVAVESAVRDLPSSRARLSPTTPALAADKGPTP